MSASTQSAGLPSNIAERLFAEHVAQLERGEPVDFEAFCQAHPEHAQDLRRCHADWTNWLSVVERMSGLDAPPKAIGSLLDRLRRHTASADRFRVEGEVGRGGMGSVLRVWDEDLRRPLAMKVALPPSTTTFVCGEGGVMRNGFSTRVSSAARLVTEPSGAVTTTS